MQDLIFTLTGSPDRGDAKMEGRPLLPAELFSVIDLDHTTDLLAYYRGRRAPGWMTGQSFDPLPVYRFVGRAGDLPKLSASDEDRRLADAAEQIGRAHV